jgi:YbbR domain-containing protein
MKKSTKIFDRLLDNKQFMMLFSIVAAFLFWFFVVANISPNSTRTISGVPVTVDESSGLITKTGLHVIDKSSSKIDQSTSKISVMVTGPRYIIGKLEPSDFIVTPDLGKVTKSGKINLKLEPAMKNPDPSVKINQISPSHLDFDFDTVVSKSFPVEVREPNNSKVADGYIMETPIVSPKLVAVTGPSSEVSQVAHVITSIKIDNNAKSTITQKSGIFLYDANNKLLDLKHTRIDNQNATVTVPIQKTADVKLTVDFANVPMGFSTSNIKFSINPAKIVVYGEENDINALTFIKLADIDFLSLDLSNNINDNIVEQKGITSEDNITSAVVSIDLLNTAKKTLSTKNINVINIPKGYSVRVRTTQLNNINIFGPSADIGNVSTVTATVNMATVNIVQGTYEVPVSISVPGRTGYWSTGKYQVTINAWKS